MRWGRGSSLIVPVRRRHSLPLGVALVAGAVCLLLTVATSTAPASQASAAGDADPAGTLRVAMTVSANSFFGFDPQEVGTTTESEVLSCCLQRTLMAHPGVVGYQGLQPRPDLADGPPTVSADGLTWTFHIRPGVHYAPPLEHVEVTSDDFVRALMRSAVLPGGQAFQLPGLLVGFDEFASGEADTISGALTPDASTLQLQLLHPEPDLDQILTAPWSAPIPPGLDDDVLKGTNGAVQPGIDPDGGYGIFQSATGPYMFEGADQVDYPAQGPPLQRPSGYDEPVVSGRSDAPILVGGSFTLVRNPSWQQDLDPVRPALPDRIVITLQTADAAYTALRSGRVDTVIGASPTRTQLSRLSSPSQRERVARFSGNATYLIAFNQAQPPFDDVAMRRAFAAALHPEVVRRGLAEQHNPIEYGPPPSHLLPDPLIDDLLARWSSPATRAHHAQTRPQAHPTTPGRPSSSRCRQEGCRLVTFGVDGGATPGPATREIAATMRRIGLRARFQPNGDCTDPSRGPAACLFGWGGSYAAFWVSVMFQAPSPDAVSYTAMGMTPRGMRSAGLTYRHTASIQPQYDTCAPALSVQQAPCWARLDQWLTDRVVAAVPVASSRRVRIVGDRVTHFSVDQFDLEVALNRTELAPSTR